MAELSWKTLKCNVGRVPVMYEPQLGSGIVETVQSNEDLSSVLQV